MGQGCMTALPILPPNHKALEIALAKISVAKFERAVIELADLEGCQLRSRQVHLPWGLDDYKTRPAV